MNKFHEFCEDWGIFCLVIATMIIGTVTICWIQSLNPALAGFIMTCILFAVIAVLTLALLGIGLYTVYLMVSGKMKRG